eukprot:1667507-Karenia_brevis.AAC.1
MIMIMHERRPSGEVLLHWGVQSVGSVSTRAWLVYEDNELSRKSRECSLKCSLDFAESRSLNVDCNDLIFSM